MNKAMVQEGCVGDERFGVARTAVTLPSRRFRYQGRKMGADWPKVIDIFEFLRDDFRLAYRKGRAPDCLSGFRISAARANAFIYFRSDPRA